MAKPFTRAMWALLAVAALGNASVIPDECAEVEPEPGPAPPVARTALWTADMIPSLDPGVMATPATGIATTVSLNGLRSLSRGLVPIIEAGLPSASLPDVPFDKLGFEGKISGISCGKVSLGGLDVKTGEEGSRDRSLTASAFNMSLACTADFAFQLKAWPHWPKGQGKLQLDMSGANAGAEVAVRGKLPGQLICDDSPVRLGMVRPGIGRRLCLASRAVTVDVGTLDVTFTEGPPVITWLANLLVDLFKGSVSSFVAKGAENALRHAIDEQASGAVETATSLHPFTLPAFPLPPQGQAAGALWKGLAATVALAAGQAPVRDFQPADPLDAGQTLGLRMSLSRPPQVHGNSSYEPGKGHIHIALRGDVLPGLDRPHARLPLAAPPIPALGQTAPGHHLQVWASNYSLASPVYAVAAAGAANLTLGPRILPESLNTTEGWDAIVPALPDAFGERTGVGIRLALPTDTLPDWAVSSWPDGQGSHALCLSPVVSLVVYPDGPGQPPVPAVTWTADAAVNISVWIPQSKEQDEPVLHLNISSGSFVLREEGIVTHPALGPHPEVQTAGLNRMLSIGINRIVIPIINNAMEAGIPLPPIPLGPLPAPNGTVPMEVGLALVRTRLVGRGDVTGDGQADATPTRSSGLYLTTDLDLVVRPVRRHVDGEVGGEAPWQPWPAPRDSSQGGLYYPPARPSTKLRLDRNQAGRVARY